MSCGIGYRDIFEDASAGCKGVAEVGGQIAKVKNLSSPLQSDL
jgi:hypothetical protein